MSKFNMCILTSLVGWCIGIFLFHSGNKLIKCAHMCFYSGMLMISYKTLWSQSSKKE